MKYFDLQKEELNLILYKTLEGSEHEEVLTVTVYFNINKKMFLV